MKYNPRINEELASLPGIAALHPWQDEDTVQGMLQMCYEFQQMLREISAWTGSASIPREGPTPSSPPPASCGPTTDHSTWGKRRIDSAARHLATMLHR